MICHKCGKYFIENPSDICYGCMRNTCDDCMHVIKYEFRYYIPYFLDDIIIGFSNYFKNVKIHIKYCSTVCRNNIKRCKYCKIFLRPFGNQICRCGEYRRHFIVRYPIMDTRIICRC